LTDGRILRIRPETGVFEFWDAEAGTAARIPLPIVKVAWDGMKIVWQRWGTGDSSGDANLVIVHTAAFENDGLNGRPDPARVPRVQQRQIAVIDTERKVVSHTYPFDRRVHGGEANQNSWHHLYAGGGHLFVTLSGFDAPGGAPPASHYRFALDGSEWTQISNRGDAMLDDPGSLSQSHAVYDAHLGAFGYDRHVYIWNLRNLGIIRRFSFAPEALGGWGHGYIDAQSERALFSFAAWNNPLIDELLYSWDWNLCKHPVPVAVVTHELPGGFVSRARPFLSPDGRTAVWHEGRASGATRVVLRMKTFDSTCPSGFGLP